MFKNSLIAGFAALSVTGEYPVSCADVRDGGIALVCFDTGAAVKRTGIGTGETVAYPAARNVVRIPACSAGIGLGGVAAVGVSAVGMSAAALCVFGFFAFCRFGCFGRAFAPCRV